MNIQPAFSAGPAGATGMTSVSFPTQSGGTSPGGLDSLRADWHVRMNISHESGFVGGAGRLLVVNLVVDEKRELVLLLPAALQDRPGRLELQAATVCSTKPGVPGAAGDRLEIRPEGAKVVVKLPLLNMGDWVYIDFTWTGGFAQGGSSFPGAQVPVGDFHPQIAVPVTTDNGQPALAPVPSRYDVELGTDLGATVRLDGAATEGENPPKPSEDGTMTMHEFKSYGSARIEAVVVPAGAAI